MFSLLDIQNKMVNSFNYFNGKINKTNPCDIRISYITKTNSVLASYLYPGAIVIYPKTLYDMYLSGKVTEQGVDYYSIITIVHELYHADQFIRYSKLHADFDSSYRNKLESQVEFMSLSYVMTNMQKIMLDLGINLYPFNDYMKSEMDRFKCSIFYSRVTQYEQFVLLLDYLSMGKHDEDIFNILNALNEKKLDIIYDIKINDKLWRLEIKSGNREIPIDKFNSFIYDKVFSNTSFNATMLFKYDTDKITANINIHSAIKNMVTKVV